MTEAAADSNDLEFPIGGQLRQVAVDLLRPDAWNPRLLPEIQGAKLAPDALYKHLDEVYDVVSIARSIVRYGYFGSEPLIAVPAKGAYSKGRAPLEISDVDLAGPFVVVEGNRRLAAIRGLSDPRIRDSLNASGWETLPRPGQVAIPAELPVLLVDHRDRVAPILGYRHITGIAEWDPLPQAKFIADFVDDKAYTFEQVASIIDRPETEVRSYYRNFWIQKQAEDRFKISDSSRITDEFGVFTRAMQTPNIRTYIGAPAPRDVDPEHFMLPDERVEQLTRLTTWLFGEPRTKSVAPVSGKRPGQIISDSRQLTALGRVLVHSRARKILERTGDYKLATEATRSQRDNLAQQLLALQRAVRISRKNAEGRDLELLDELAALLKRAIKQFDASDRTNTDS